VTDVGRAAGPTTREQPPTDLSQLRDITGIEKVPAAPADDRWMIWLGVSLAVAVVGLVVFWWLRRRRALPAPAAPPGPWALVELDRVEALALPVSGRVERYHTLISDVIRRYLELRYALRAPQQSTEEFLEAMRSSPHLPAEQKELLRDFLGRCDLAKFARAGFSAEECAVAARMARQFVEQTMTAAYRSPQPASNPPPQAASSASSGGSSATP
jgi:hypothetical protein